MTPTVANVYKTLLKDSNTHTQKYLDDLDNDYLPATVKNKIILAKNKGVFEDNPDFDLDHIDNVLGEPEDISKLSDDDAMKLDAQYQQDAAYEQVPNEQAAEALANNYGKEKNYFNALAAVPKEHKKEARGLRRQAFDNVHDMTLDTILKRLYAKQDMSDHDKIEAALRLMYNNATRDWATGPVDMKLDQDEIANAMLLNGTYDAMKAIDPKFLDRVKVHTDQVPMTYMSDKSFEDGAEESLFKTTDEANTVYDMFAKKYLEDLANNSAPDRSELPIYIMKLFADKLKTMTAVDWQNELDKEAEALNKAKEDALGRPLEESEKIELEFNPDTMLTPEDWADQLPDNPRLNAKSAEEKADSKLNRWHGDSKEEYKEFLKEMAAKSVEGSKEYKQFEQELAMLSMSILADAINNKIPSLIDELEFAEIMGEEARVKQIGKKLLYYKTLTQDTPEGREELRYQAYRNLIDSHRRAHGLDDEEGLKERIAASKDRNAAYKEYKELMKAKNTPEWFRAGKSGTSEEKRRQVFDDYEALQKDLDKGIDK